jgi:signal transduction histidine kinase
VQIQYATGRPGLPESGVTVPLCYAGRVIGVLSVQSYQPEAYDEADLALLMAVAGPAALAIEHLRSARQLDAQLQRQVSELEAILGSMAEALLIVDAEGLVVRLNQAARSLLCVDDTSIILGQPLDREQWGQWPSGAREVAEALSPVQAALRRGEVRRDVEVQMHERGRRVLSFSCSPIHDARGALSGGVIAVRDVTGRREIEHLKDEIPSITSHDLRTPVTLIKAQAQRLEPHVNSGCLAPAFLAESSGRIVRQVNYLVSLLDRLLDLSCIEASRLTLHRQPCDPVALARIVLDTLQAITDEHRLVLAAPPSIRGLWDSQRLEQVLQNLVANAIKYSPDGCTVEVTLTSTGTQAQVCVRDEGVGIPPEELERIFERFYRVNRPRRLTGAGLGLYICREIIAAHGGHIWAESAGPGYGSRFCFTLPLYPPGTAER